MLLFPPLLAFAGVLTVGSTGFGGVADDRVACPTRKNEEEGRIPPAWLAMTGGGLRVRVGVEERVGVVDPVEGKPAPKFAERADVLDPERDSESTRIFCMRSEYEARGEGV